jgi:hypothetical protein
MSLAESPKAPTLTPKQELYLRRRRLGLIPPPKPKPSAVVIPFSPSNDPPPQPPQAPSLQEEVPPPPLKEEQEDPADRPATFMQVMRAVSKYYQISIIEMRANRRQKQVVLARQVACYLGRELTHLSLPMMGQKLCRDHTTVLHGIERVRERLFDQPELHRDLDRIRDLVPTMKP